MLTNWNLNRKNGKTGIVVGQNEGKKIKIYKIEKIKFKWILIGDH